jgi:hypothetical protein
MTRVVLQPAGGRESRKHFADTIQRPVPFDRLRRFLPELEMAALRDGYEGESVPAWGITPRAGRPRATVRHV